MSREILPEDLEKAFEAMRDTPAPNPAHYSAARQAFLAQARQMRREQAVSHARTMRHKEQIYRQRKEGSLMVTLAKIMIALLVLSGAATGTAFAADASLPGQPLYPLDLQIEQVQRALAATPEARANLSLSLAAERANEVRTMLRAGETPDQAVTERLRAQFEVALQLAARLQDQEMVRLLTQLRDMAQEHAGQMQAYSFAQGETIMTRVREQAQNGIDDPLGFQEQYRNGNGWPEGKPEITGEPTPQVAPTAGNGEQERSREQDQEQTRECESTPIGCQEEQQCEQERTQEGEQQGGSPTPQGPNPTPGGGGGNGNGGPGGGG